ncbi:MAG TPA: GxxExxY protein [Candidatus Methylomirabilis sp.]|nr:GxxExxY protein [Candidatus Methylomirabilis sp.]
MVTTRRSEPSPALDALAHEVIDAALEVHRWLGPGYLESCYEEALAIELRERQIAFRRQAPISVDYKGRVVGEGRADFIVGDGLLVELKTVEALAPMHKAQVLSYLKATRGILGLLINFNVPVLRDGIRRVVRSSP